MKIKEIKAHGFKSFADGIRLEVHGGVTAVVGPNGCGKSNIVDAVRWVMGEISAKHLRGSSMQDVIFGGTEYRKPLGRAEVSIVLQDLAALPDPYNHFTELEVSRRLYRTGESEYFINRTACRRRDIAELFLESGVGTRSIAIIEQGHVGDVVNAKATERRFFVEQAAGILKYKSRREEALRKLEGAKQNLLRVEDILRELTRQRAQVERQAEKARKHQEIVTELRNVELSWAVGRFLESDDRRQQLMARAQELDSQQEAQTEKLSELEERIAAAREQRSERERELGRAQDELRDIERRIAELESVRSVARESIRLHVANAEQAATEVERLTRREEELTTEVERLAAEHVELESRLAEGNERLLAEKDRVAELSARCRSVQAERDEVRTKLSAISSERELCANNILHTEKLREESARRLGRLESDAEEIASHVAELSQNSFGFAEALKSSRESFEGLTHKTAATQKRLEFERGRLEEIRETLRQSKSDLSEKATRLSSLREIERRYEGYGEGVQAIMLEAERRLAEEGRNGIYGLVADVLKTRPDFERAVESLLGERLQYIVVKSQNESVEAVEFLKREAKGRGSFVPLTLRAAPAAAEAAGEGVVGPLREIVEVKEGYDAVADYLLGDAILVDRLDRALGLWEENGQDRTFVTMDGDVVDRSGVITGGTAGGAGTGILRKRREIEELTEAVEQAAERIHDLELHESSQVAAVATVEGELEDLKVRLHRLEIDITSQEKDVQRIDEERAQANRRREGIEAELAGERERLTALEEELERGRTRRAELESACGEAREALLAIEARLTADEDARAAAVVQLEEIKIVVASLRERAESLAGQLSRTQYALQELDQQRAERSAQSERERAEVGRLELQLESGAAELDERTHAREELQQKVSELRSSFEAGAEQLSELEERLQRERSGLDEVRQRLSEQKMALRESELSLQWVIEDIAERYELDLRAHTESLGDAEKERLRNPEIRAELHEETERQKRRLKNLGSVNVDALAEYDEILEREQFLQNQRDDLVNSVRDLVKAIAKINKTTRERFRETFDAVNANFQKVFPRLFLGGKARLELTDEANILESGIDIIAQPPGKKLGDMNMLSGGEKALTAVALLLSIFLIKPAPFVILDEVDAPLDDANVSRFSEIVKELTSHSQVIMITHNKSTMEIADTLAGITMEEPGVSKLVTVALD